MTDFLGRLAAVCGRAGQVEEGLAVVGEALAYRETNGETYFEPELYRLRGELLQQQGPNMAVAEADLQRAVSVARDQKARMLEVRATVSLCRLLQQQDRGEEARQALAEIYGWFTEGLEEPVLLEAKNLLDELS
jgi:predicted ATPase